MGHTPVDLKVRLCGPNGIERDVISRGVFSSVSDLARKLRRYIRAYSAHAKPFKWKYSDPTRHIGNVPFATRH